jgi:hypothetical protein
MIKEVAAGWEDAATAERTMNDTKEKGEGAAATRMNNTKNHIQWLRAKEPGREGGVALALF